MDRGAVGAVGEASQAGAEDGGMTIRLGIVEWMTGDECYRPSLWIRLPGWWLALFFGWQKPSVVWLSR